MKELKSVEKELQGLRGAVEMVSKILPCATLSQQLNFIHLLNYYITAMRNFIIKG